MCLSINLSIFMFVYHICLSNHLLTCVCLSIYLSLYLSYVSSYIVSVYYSSVNLFLYLFICLRLSTYLLSYSSIYLSTCIYIYLLSAFQGVDLNMRCCCCFFTSVYINSIFHAPYLLMAWLGDAVQRRVFLASSLITTIFSKATGIITWIPLGVFLYCFTKNPCINYN